MNPVGWTSGDVVLTCQLVSATALAVHLLVLRPRAASQDLRLDARIIHDELDLAERLGHVSSTDVETIALQQLLCRVRRNPSSAGLVLARIPALARSVGYRSRPVEAEYLLGALDRLSDAGRRYLRTAWPRTGSLSAAMTSTPAMLRERELRYLDDDIDFAGSDFAGSDFDDVVSVDQVSVDDAELDVPDLNGSDSRADTEQDDARNETTDLGKAPGSESDLAPDRNATVRLDLDTDRNSGRRSDRDGEQAEVELSEPDDAPAWVDLVRAETPRRNSGLGLADRHARPYRPARSSGHAASRRIEQPDRSSVLPR
ncbi:MAG TPA: hypothetical protein VLL08_27935 [Kineosporiaceae bacterium]|nr:hypothetical protein [Kineosporiaceae bacterium]